MTIDGFIAGPDGEMDWLSLPWTEDINAYVAALTEPVGTIILGRKLAEGFIPYWASVAADPQHPEVSSGKTFTDTPKVVFTKTLTASTWPNTVLAKGDLVDEVARLKAQSAAAGDIIAYGGATFVAALIRHSLIDELHLFVNPAAIGKGMPIFTEITSKQNLKLVNATPFGCGIVALHYEPA